MKAFPIILAALGFALGAGLVSALKSGGGDTTDLEAKLAATEKRLADLESKSRTPTAMPTATPAQLDEPAPSDRPAKSGLTAILEQMGKPDENGEQLSPEEQIAKLTNTPEARAFMKGMAGIMTQRADKWIEGEVEKYGAKLELTDAQSATIKNRMVAMVKENTEKFQAELDDDSRSTREIMEEQGDFWQQNEANIEAMLKEELNDEQFAQFQTEQLVERTQRVQRSADRELEAIDTKLELDEAQEDQVFAILVRESSEYDESMAIEGIESGLPPGATAEDVTKDDAIRSVLTPDQTETYNATLEDGGFTRRRGPWGPR